MFQAIGLTEILLALGILFLLFGFKRMPQIGRHLGEGISNFYRAVTGRLSDEPPPLQPPDSTEKK